jgi:hypothetical protein
MEALRSFKMSGNTNIAIWWYIPEDMNPQQDHCGSLKFCVMHYVSLTSVMMVRVEFCWDVKPCNLMDRYQHFTET